MSSAKTNGDSKFGWYRPWLWAIQDDKHLSSKAKAVAAVLARLERDDGWVNPPSATEKFTHAKIGEKASFSAKTSGRAVAELVDRGWVKIQARTRDYLTLRLLWPRTDNLSALDGQEVAPGRTQGRLSGDTVSDTSTTGATTAPPQPPASGGSSSRPVLKSKKDRHQKEHLTELEAWAPHQAAPPAELVERWLKIKLALTECLGDDVEKFCSDAHVHVVVDEDTLVLGVRSVDWAGRFIGPALQHTGHSIDFVPCSRPAA